jgi:uncharacterized membrane protein (UPF0127 family)
MLKEHTKKIKWALSLSLVAAAIFVIVIIFATRSQNGLKTLEINGTKIHVEIATTSQEKEKGLCCRESLPKNQGMLFVYQKPGDHRFWMKDTKIPLDMYWINSSKKIVYLEENVQPNSYPKSFGTNIPSQYILETNAGFAKAHDIKVGDTVVFEN